MGNQDHAIYNRLKNIATDLLNRNLGVEHFILNVCESDIACFSWHREFDDRYSGETAPNGLCGWLALEQLSRRDSWRIPKCLELRKRVDKDKLANFMSSFNTTAPQTLLNRLNTITTFSNTKFTMAPENLWLNGDDMAALSPLIPPTAWWHKDDGLCKPHSTHHGGMLTWTEISSIAKSGRHIGLWARHFSLLKWDPLELITLTEHMEDLLKQIYHNLTSHNANTNLPPTLGPLPPITDLTIEPSAQPCTNMAYPSPYHLVTIPPPP